MYARTRNIEIPTLPPKPAAAAPCLVPVSQIRAGQHFIRLDSPSEVLVLLSSAGGDCHDTQYAWAVVVAVNHDSEGYVPGQLLRLKRTTHVRTVHEVRAPVFEVGH